MGTLSLVKASFNRPFISDLMPICVRSKEAQQDHHGSNSAGTIKYLGVLCRQAIGNVVNTFHSFRANHGAYISPHPSDHLLCKCSRGAHISMQGTLTEQSAQNPLTIATHNTSSR